jgi:hypothetical protein
LQRQGPKAYEWSPHLSNSTTSQPRTADCFHVLEVAPSHISCYKQYEPFFLNRFGFHNTSSIDSLLDKEDVSLEAILDEDDLLQECKSQNTRLIDYFQRVDVLKRLLGYVTGEIEGEEESRRYK